MFSKIFLVAAIISVATAQYGGYGHGHGHAQSSQNVVLHQTHGHTAHHAPALLVQHHQPIHHAPALLLQHHQPIHHVGHYDHHEDHHAPAHYAFEYSVADKHTGDIKSQHESREGDAVHGSYSLHEADGTVRVVDYTADAHHGFNAVVHREGHATHAVPVHGHVTYAAPAHGHY